MILILTYHKISPPGHGAAADFYTVSRDSLTQQLEAATQAGFQPLAPVGLQSSSGSVAKTFLASFDDGTADHFDEVLPLLKKFSLRGIFFVPTAKLNRPGYLNEDQVRALADAGQTIGCHSHDHKRLDTMPPAEIRRQLETSQELLAHLTGAKPQFFAPPGGYINAPVRTEARRLGLNVIRTMRWGFNRRPDLGALETIPINRHTTAAKFQKILAGKQPPFLYLGKQAAKALFPARAYERLRGTLFRRAGKN